MNDFLSALLGVGIVALSTWYMWKSRGEYLPCRIERGFPRSARPIVRIILLVPMALILLIGLIAAIVRRCRDLQPSRAGLDALFGLFGQSASCPVHPAEGRVLEWLPWHVAIV